MKKIDFKNKLLWLYLIYVVLMVLLIVGLVFLLIESLPEFFGRLSYNLNEVYTADHSLYFAVGKGMLQGLKPYRDMYENKPPLIFLLSALSYLMMKNYYLLNIFCFISILVVALVPTIYLIIISIKNKANPFVSSLLGLGVLFISILFAIYGDQRSGEAQIELFGVASSIMSIFFLLLIKDKSKFYSPYIILSGFFFGIALMFKEPHGFLLVFLFLLFISTRKGLLNRFIYPLAYGGITAFIILIASNSIDTYFSIYLSTMFSNHISNSGSPLERMFNLERIVKNLKQFSTPLPYIVLILLVSNITIISYRAIKSETIYTRLVETLHLLLIFITMFIASFTVGVGGHYFNHHYAFAISFYIALVFLLIDNFPFGQAKFIFVSNNKIELKPAINLACVSIFSVFSFIYSYKCFKATPEYHPNYENIERTTYMKNLNTYVDQVCDTLEIDRYLYIGFNGWHTYGYGDHLPLGPNFGQDQDLFVEKDNYFVESFLNNLYSTELVIYYHNYTNVIKDDVNVYLKKHFTLTPPTKVIGIPYPEGVELSNYKFYYRTSY